MNNEKLPRSLEIKLRDSLKTFCQDNANSICGCEWINSDYCMKSCKYYQMNYTHKEMGTEKGEGR